MSNYSIKPARLPHFTKANFAMLLTTLLTMACQMPAPKADQEGSVNQEQITSTTVVTTTTQTTRVTDKKTQKTKSQKKDTVTQVDEKYSRAKTIKANVTKTLRLEMLEQTRENQGTLEIKKPGQFRIEFKGQEHTMAVSDSKTVWLVTFPTDPDFDNTVRVMKTQNTQRLQAQSLLGFLLGKGGFLKDFSRKSEKQEGDLLRVALIPKKNKSEVKDLELVISHSRLEITEISYKDELQNKTTINLSDTEFDLKISTERFKYNLPEKAEVTDI